MLNKLLRWLHFFMTEMDNNSKKACQYGAKCYRKRQSHLRDYYHPTETSGSSGGEKLERQSGNVFDNNATKKIQTRGNGFDKSTQPSSDAKKKGKHSLDKTQSEKRRKSASKNTVNKVKKAKKNQELIKEKHEGNQESNSNSSKDSDNSENDIKSNSWTYIKAPAEAMTTTNELQTPKNETIKSYYSVDMPYDFYSFFEFCESINKKEPLNALKPFGLDLVGPFDILAGKDINVDRNMILCHWRYYYDPPEFQTVLASKSGFHLGYWRDAPHDQPALVASNNSEDCSFKIEGENLFGAVNHYLTEFIETSNPFRKAEAVTFQSTLRKWSKENKYSLEKLTQNIKNRQKRINSRTFHGMGIVVPVEKKTEVGYRPLIETDANLKKICKLIMEASSEDEQEILMEKLQPLITFANIANDECDFGNGLELGIDLFCMGSPVFHSVIEHLLTTAYNLLKRSEFGEIIRAHLKNRKKEKNMSVI